MTPTVLGALETTPLFTTSPKTYEPAMSALKLGAAVAALLKLAVLPLGLEITDHE